MRKYLITILGISLLFSCNNNHPLKPGINNNKNLVTVYSDDPFMNEAISKARETFDEFEKAFTSNKYDTSTFALKVRFNTENGGEHIWATGLTFENGYYFGTIDDLPVSTTEVKAGGR